LPLLNSRTEREFNLFSFVLTPKRWIESIHPFIDGNGRTGRLILNLERIKAGLLPVNIKFEDRRKYYDCFDDYYGKNHTSEMLSQLIANYEVNELEQHIKILEG